MAYEGTAILQPAGGEVPIFRRSIRWLHSGVELVRGATGSRSDARPQAGLGASMANLKAMTVRALRELARKHIGPGFSKLKTKSEIVAALAAALPRSLAKALEVEALEAPRPEATPRGRSEGARAGGGLPPPRTQGPKPAPERVPAPTHAMARGERAPAEPDPEGHLVARVAGERAARSSLLPLVEEKVPPTSEREPEGYDERLGELPDGYGEDAVVLLAKDPRSLFLYWDFNRETVERAFSWMPGLHTRVRLFADDVLEREVDFALEARSWYFHDLRAGRTYHAELMSHAIDGQVRRIGCASNKVRLPPEGPSHLTDDRFLRIAWEVPPPVVASALRRAPEPPLKGTPEGPPTPPPFSEEVREALYFRSGGAGRPLGSSELMTPEAASAPGAPGPARGPAVLGPSPAGVRSSGPWPWSGSIPAWSGTLPRR